MKRHHAHRLFGTAAVIVGVLLAHQAWRLHAAWRLNDDVARTLAAPAAAVQPGDDAPDEARFAQAVALAKAGDVDAALKAYKALVEGDRADLRGAALYNAGNLHLREALKNGEGEAIRSLPLIELAKQHYRDLLRADPGRWDARYNLERALWLAPEADDAASADDARTTPRERAITTMRSDGGDLP
jgi:mxaK protein